MSWPPLVSGSWETSNVFGDNTTDLRASKAVAEALMFSISPAYFQAAGTAVLTGRAFTWHDDKNAPRVALVNQEFARRLFGSVANAMGKQYKMPDGARIRIVGIVENGKYRNLAEDPRPAMFFPILQVPSGTNLIVRSDRRGRQLASAIRSSVRRLDPALPFSIESFDKRLDLPLFPARVATLALGVLGAMGALLSVTGVFGMAAYSVSKRLKELGIRMALGAQRKEILGAALGRALRVLTIGSAAGLC